MTNQETVTINFEQAEKALNKAYKAALDGNTDDLQEAWETYCKAVAEDQRRRIREANRILYAYFDKLKEIRDAQLAALRQRDTARGITEFIGDEQYFDSPERVTIARVKLGNKSQDSWEVCFPTFIYTMSEDSGHHEITLNAEYPDCWNMGTDDPDGRLLKALTY